MRSGGAIPPLKRGISAIPARDQMKIWQMRAIPPSAILFQKGVARYGGGISHWAAKLEPPEFKSTVNLSRKETQTMVRVSSPAKLRPLSELTAKMVMGVVPGLVISMESVSECACFALCSSPPLRRHLRIPPGWVGKRKACPSAAPPNEP